MNEAAPNEKDSAFKRSHTRYRRRRATAQPDADLDDDLLDFSSDPSNDERIEVVETCSLQEDCYRGPVYGLKDFPGFLYAPQALPVPLQRAVAYAAVTKYCETPHATNIDATIPPSSQEGPSLWEEWKKEHGFCCSSVPSNNNKPSHKRKRNLRNLSWACAGYHYDWTARAYHKDHKSPMPKELSKLSVKFARTSLWHEAGPRENNGSDDGCSSSYAGTACIVNYYHAKSVMGGHRDDLEHALDKPIVSFSMGRPAVFLLGGATLDEQPVVAIRVRPGDVMMMGGDCRLNYHSMPRLLSADSNSQESSSESIAHRVQLEDVFAEGSVVIRAEDQDALTAFLADHRININVRQVYPGDVELSEKAMII